MIFVMVLLVLSRDIEILMTGYLPQSALLYALYIEVVAWKEMKEIS